MAKITDFDPEHLAKAAEEALTRPSNSAMWDDRLYSTHGPVIGWAERGDDLVEESNYLMALDRLRAAADDGREDTEVSDEHVIDATIRDWLVGSLRQVFVQVYETPEECSQEDCDEPAEWMVLRSGESDRDRMCTPCLESLRADVWSEYRDASDIPYDLYDTVAIPREYTAAFLEAVEIADELRDYPILDESDYSEREWERFEESLSEALADVHKEFEHDTEADQDAIREHAHEHLGDTMSDNGFASWTLAAEVYREHRDLYFTELAREHFLAQIPGQTELQLSV
jgi:hypothetical protein